MGAIGLDVRLWSAALAISAAVWGSVLVVAESTKEVGGPPIASTRVFASAPVFSPDGSRIAFTCKGSGGYGACVIAAGGGDSDRLAEIKGYPDARPAFTPDGRLAFIGRHGDVDAVYVIDTRATGGSAAVLLVDLGADSTYPVFPAAGKHLAFVRQFEEGSFVYIIEADGTGRSRVGPPGANEPALSPDGKTIAFIGEVTRGERGNYELAVMGIDGSGEKRLTDDGGNDNHHPAFAPDGRTIAFDRFQDGVGAGVFTVGIDGSGERRVIPTGTEPAFSPDGRRIAFVRDGEIWVINVDGTGEKQLTSAAAQESEAR